MVPINYSAIITATIAAFLFSALYYFILNKKVVRVRESYLSKDINVSTTTTPTKIIVELTRTFIVGLAMAYAVINAQNLAQASIVVIWLWIAFPVVILVGSTMYEHFPPKLAVIHAIDWLVKLLIFSVILTLWR